MARPAPSDLIEPDADRPGWTGRDWPAIGRVALWAFAAFAMLMVAFAAARSETGARRLAELSGAKPTEPPPVALAMEAMRATLVAEIEGMGAALRRLELDRDRLAERLGAVERGLSVTGSLGAQPVGGADPPRAEPAAQTSSAQPADAQRTEAQPADAQPASAAAPEASTTGDRQAVGGWTSFGLDLGTASSLDELRQMWAVARTQHGGVLEGLHPVAAIRNAAPPAGFEIRLVVGPLANAVAAARLCAVLGTTGRACLPAPFEGQRLHIP